MQQLRKHRLRPADLWLFGGILLTALCLWLGLTWLSPRGAFAVVTADGHEVARLPLDRDCTQTVETAYGTHTVVVSGGRVSVTEAPCRDQICVRHAPVSRGGETIVCLPCAVVVTVTEGDGAVLHDTTPTTHGEVFP